MKQVRLSVAFFELHGFNEPHIGDPGLLVSRSCLATLDFPVHLPARKVGITRKKSYSMR